MAYNIHSDRTLDVRLFLPEELTFCLIRRLTRLFDRNSPPLKKKKVRSSPISAVHVGVSPRIRCVVGIVETAVCAVKQNPPLPPHLDPKLLEPEFV
jgi:hypothetical protein